MQLDAIIQFTADEKSTLKKIIQNSSHWSTKGFNTALWYVVDYTIYPQESKSFDHFCDLILQLEKTTFSKIFPSSFWKWYISNIVIMFNTRVII